MRWSEAVAGGLPNWVLVAPAVVIWALAVLDVATDRRLHADGRLLWLVFLVVAAPLAPLRFVLRRRVVERRGRAPDPARLAYIERVEDLRRSDATAPEGVGS